MYGSVCSGIESATVAWHPLGMRPQFFSEIELFPCAALAHHYPHVPNWGDMTRFAEWPDAAIDVLVGGTPCQSFSVAGLRVGLDDPRGNLTLTYLAIAKRYRPRWLVWENVPGVLSHDNGRTFGAILGGVAKLGYGFAYRVLDAQYIRVDGFARAVPQRRRRVFLVGYLGDWRCAAAVLFERESLSWNPAPRREPGTRIAATITRADGFDASEDGTGRGTPLVPICFDETQITHPENRCNPQPGDPSHALAAHSRPPTIAFNARQDPDHWLEATGPLDTDGTTQAIYTLASRGRDGGHQLEFAVRRLTPRECERLQGFDDDYTLIPFGRKGKLAADGPRYKALGNSKAVNCVRWIGARIKAVDSIAREVA